MSKIVSRNAARALHNGAKYSNGKNTRVIDGQLMLHGNIIAEAMGESTLIRNCGWFTLTTRDRLNALDGVSIVQRRGKWYLNGFEWDGNDIVVQRDGVIAGPPIRF